MAAKFNKYRPYYGVKIRTPEEVKQALEEFLRDPFNEGGFFFIGCENDGWFDNDITFDEYVKMVKVGLDEKEKGERK